MNIGCSSIRVSWVLVFICLIPLQGPAGMSQAFAQGDPVIPKAIKGFDEEKVKADPVCDSSRRPTISKVDPDEMKVGDTVVVTGKDFGRKKECFHGISFGPEPATQVMYVDSGKVEVVVPAMAPRGLTFLNLMTSGGAARKGILVQSEK